MFGDSSNNRFKWINSLSCKNNTNVENAVICNNTKNNNKKRWNKDAQIVPTTASIDKVETPRVIVSGRDEAPPVINTEQQSKHLENLYVMIGSQERVIPNNAAVTVDTELFYGKMLLMFRTPDDNMDVSNKQEKSSLSFFKGKQRRFEFQWQFKLKEVPKGEVCFCAELGEPIEMGIIQRALTSTALRFVKKMNPGFSYFLSDSYEKPSYLSFPVSTSMDAFVATNPGMSDLPVLGREISESKESVLQRKKGKKIDWNVDDVYTMSFSSMYLDFISWRLMNFPGLKPFSVNSVAGIQPMKLTLYTHRGKSVLPSVKSDEDQRNIIFSMEVSNASKSILGKDAKEWLKLKEKQKAAAIPPKTNISLSKGDEVSADVTNYKLFDELQTTPKQPNHYDLWSFFAVYQ